jgi:hypothetical protein
MAGMTNGLWLLLIGDVHYQHTNPRSTQMILFVPLSNPQSAATTRTIEHLEAKVSAPEVASAHRYRERDYGVGYGSSSGYASGRSYANHNAQPLFRCG